MVKAPDLRSGLCIKTWVRTPHLVTSIYNKRTSFCGRSLCLSRIMCQHRLLPQNGTCPSPDVVAVMTQFLMTQQLASPPDVYSIAVMTKSSSKVLVRFPTIKSITGRSCYRKANSNKTIQLFARKKFPGFDRGSGYS